jgi:hypothetical protein
VEEGERWGACKLLRVPFGLNLDTTEMDVFIIEKLQKKLNYWNNLHLPLASTTIVINSMLKSTLVCKVQLKVQQATKV